MSTNHTDALLRFVRRWFDERTVASVFEPLLADHQREWLDAPPAARLRIAMRTAAVLIASIIRLAPRALLLTPTPPSLTRRALSRIIVFTSVVATLLTIPIMMETREMSPLETIIAALFVLPSAIAIAFPFSMLWAADAIRRNPVAAWRERTTALRFGIAAVVFMLALTGWVVPAMNQLYRQVAAPDWARPPARGAREATLDELLSKHPPRLLEGRNPAIMRRERHNRAVISMLPAILLWLRFGAHDAHRKRWWSPLPVAAETVLAIALFFPLYFSSPFIERTFGLQAGTAMWVAPLGLIIVGTVRRSLAGRVVA
jgi:hypothetical protein